MNYVYIQESANLDYPLERGLLLHFYSTWAFLPIVGYKFEPCIVAGTTPDSLPSNENIWICCTFRHFVFIV